MLPALPLRSLFRLSLLLTAFLGVLSLLYYFSIRTSFLSSIKSIFVLIYKPKDYYEPISEKQAILRAGEVIRINAYPMYSGKYGVEISYGGGGFPKIGHVTCALDKKKLILIASNERYFDVHGEGVIVGVFNIDNTIRRKSLICEFTAIVAYPHITTVRIDKLSDI